MKRVATLISTFPVLLLMFCTTASSQDASASEVDPPDVDRLLQGKAGAHVPKVVDRVPLGSRPDVSRLVKTADGEESPLTAVKPRTLDEREYQALYEKRLNGVGSSTPDWSKTVKKPMDSEDPEMAGRSTRRRSPPRDEVAEEDDDVVLASVLASLAVVAAAFWYRRRGD